MTTTSLTTTTRQDGRDRLFTPAFVRLSLADLAYFTSAGVAIYVLPFYVTGPVGSDKAGAGLAFGAFAVTALLLRPFAGRLSDTVGRRPLLVAGASLCAVTMFLTSFVESLALVVALRLLLGVAEAAFFVASFAALADLAPPSRMGEALSYNSLGLYVGLALGPPLGEVLVKGLGFTAAWYGATALALLAAVIVSGIGETATLRSAADGPAHLIHRKALAPALGFFTSVVAMGGFLAFAALQADAVGLKGTSLPLFVYGSVVVVGRIAFAKIPDRLPPLPLGAAALVLIAIGLTVTAVWGTAAGMIIGTALLGLGVTFSTPAFFSAAFATAAPSERGAASGTVSAFLDLGLGGGPILLGLVAESAGIPWTFGVAAAVALAGSVWTLSLAGMSRRMPALAVQ
jgi:predicted MFS family arabinose efflux permease